MGVGGGEEGEWKGILNYQRKVSAQTILMKTRLYSKVARYSSGFKAFLILNSTWDAFSAITCFLHMHRNRHFLGSPVPPGGPLYLLLKTWLTIYAYKKY